MSPKTYFWSTH